MKKTILSFVLAIFASVACPAQAVGVASPGEAFKIEAQPAEKFAYPYYLYVPPALRETKTRKKTHTILVIPNNSGKLNDDLSAHEADVKRNMKQNAKIADQIGIAVLMPVFPRSQIDWKIYTHALDRDVMLTDKKEYARFDLQLAAMIDDARKRLKKERLKIDKRVFVLGFSASGTFANRFTFLHPKRVKAAAIGSPGGWAIAPVGIYKEKTLRYPIGTNDFKAISGENFDLKNLRKVPIFLFLGDRDENDSVTFRDGYEQEDEDLIFALFGKTPVERWKISKKLYRENQLNATFKLYPNVKHDVTTEMRADIIAFFERYVR